MIVTPQSLDSLFKAFNFAFQEGWDAAKTRAFDIAMKTASTTSREVYPWLGQFPQLREWVGDRVFNGVELLDFSITNLKFESTVNIPREKMEDDRYGAFAPLFRNMGRVARLHPDKMVFGLLKNGFNTPCYDGQQFYSATHPAAHLKRPETQATTARDAEAEAELLATLDAEAEEDSDDE